MAVLRSEVVKIREERWIKHYSSSHDILLVGEGDFSFSLCLATAFGSATNIVATSFDSYDELIKKYKKAKANLAILETLGATLLHGVDATKMKISPHLQCRKFHRIIYNFPHAGFHHKEDHPHLISMHKNLVLGFFRNARSMLWLDGEIHITHKIKPPFDSWRIQDLASNCSLYLIECADFRIQDYPSYKNKRGSGPRCDKPFHLGECRTFKFKLFPDATITHSTSQNYFTFNDRVNDGRTLQGNMIRNECFKMFDGYLKHVEDTLGSHSYDVFRSVREALRHGFNAYTHEVPGRSLSGYVANLEELHRLNILRSQRLRQMLLSVDHHQL
ncbi:hypothetical protein RD792_017992 [Penstemon davidsonii]|uniref:25S rRNA (uridine-N(3))-methyltransferase BMT5-like domain-containing protein n=1 Tax=Penstemon davidsonii TaxID=160366 RepID=A0ABR0DVB7_9LAMI|nr:hypothetical protein RD792_017992 [Penstemon davidsonii]